MEEEPLLTGSVNRASVDYGSYPGSGPPESRFTERDGKHLYIQQAAVFIEDAIQYRSINHRVDARSLRWYRWYYSRLCQWGLGIIIAIILGLAFIEEPSSLTYTSDIRYRPPPWKPPCGLTEGIEIICLCTLTVDVAVKSYLIGWDELRKTRWLIGYVLVIALSVIDWALSLSMQCTETIRVRRILRPFFLLQNSSLMKKTLKCLKRTLPEIASVIFLLALHLCLFTMFGMLLFAKTENSENNKEWEIYFSNLPKALNSLLVLLTTANNPDVMIPAYSRNRGFSIFFIIFSAIGTCFLMNLLTAIICNHFRGYLLMSVKASILRRCLGIRAAFEILYGNSQRQPREHVECVPVAVVLQVVQIVHMKSYFRKSIIRAAQQFPDDYIPRETFHKLFDELDKDEIKEHPPQPHYGPVFLQTLQIIFRHYFTTVLGNGLALANVVCICTVLVLDSHKTVTERNDCLEVINCVFILLYLMEMSLKIFAHGVRGYLSYRSNLYDGLITLCLLFLQIFIFGLYKLPFCRGNSDTQTFVSLWDILRLVNMLIIFRCLRIISDIKLMALVASTLVDIVKNLRAFAGILLVVYYVFAILGMWLFQGAIIPPQQSNHSSSIVKSVIINKSLVCGSYEQLEYWPNNFDDFASSLVLLYDIMLVNNWHVFIDVYSRFTTEWSILYFISWWIISAVMWVNLFMALILENFTYRWDRSNTFTVTDVERTAYQTTVQLIFRQYIKEPTEEELVTSLQQHPHLHISTPQHRARATPHV
ncbi:two pore channel protein 2 [Denticeps clupeoides]|uniref:two pore channel protein 2 n=1 Tax=Denticeps clupeoides TaxID=299321 RepID=UPI0010A54D80|nr:two pore calcium channel protein 2 [Denticeps clupeoides]